MGVIGRLGISSKSLEVTWYCIIFPVKSFLLKVVQLAYAPIEKASIRSKDLTSHGVTFNQPDTRMRITQTHPAHTRVQENGSTLLVEQISSLSGQDSMQSPVTHCHVLDIMGVNAKAP
jgi:hypothetical protein